MKEETFKKDELNKKKKKPYQKPEIVSEKTFETAALSCGKCEAIGPIGYCWGDVDVS